ncbi:tail completion protein [Acidovorax phage ACF1]|nr:tail completion protein [Acidovorax phage ACF1]
MSQTPIFKKGSEIAQHITTILQTITPTNGYKTEIGQTVYRGRLRHDEDRVPYAVLIEGEDRPVDHSGLADVLISQNYTIGGYVKCDPDNPNDAAHDVIADIKKAIFSSDLGWKTPAPGSRGQGQGRVKSLKYRGRDIGPRADGQGIVFAVVHITVEFAENLLDA